MWFVCVSLCLITACKQKTDPHAEHNLTASSSSQTGVTTYRSIGVIEKVDQENGSVQIKHEEIKGYMPAMSMEFAIKDRALLTSLNVGDQIDFWLEVNAGQATVTELKIKGK
jgi:Cu/Ag efflux protein CusF